MIDYLKTVNKSFNKLFLLSFLFIFTFSLYISFLETPNTRLYSNIVLVFINIIVLIGIFYAAKYTKKFDNKYFYVWGFLEISVILWILGDFLWTLQDQNIFNNLNLILFCYALRTIFLCLSIFSMPRSFTSPLVRLKGRIEILIIIVSVTMVLWSVLLYPLIIANNVGIVNIGIIIFNTALYFILIFLIISRLTYNYDNLRNNPLILILASASFQLMAAIIFGYRMSLNILNELITNSIKHGFSERKNGIIYLKSELDGQYIILTYQDNGKGLPHNFDLKNSSTIGMQLIKGLISQIEGELIIKNYNPVMFIIKFKKNQGLV